MFLKINTHEVSAISEINIGATTQVPPVAMPENTRPAYSMPTFFADAKSAHEIRYGIPKANVVHLRPIFSAKMPAGSAPMNAPTAKKDPIHDSVE